jgi:glycosyltransferase involved in cell wall biosynthesis
MPNRMRRPRLSRSRQREQRLAPLRGAQVVFVVDRLVPRLGMEKAAIGVIQALAPLVRVGVLILAGPPSNTTFPCPAVYLGHRPGVGGRLAGLPDLRRAGGHPATTFVAVGTWAAATFALANVGRRVLFILWEHTVLPWRTRHERSVTACAIALRLMRRNVLRAVAVSHANAQTVRKLTGDRVRTVVIPNFANGQAEGTVRSATPTRPGGRDRLTVLGIGSLTPRKNWRLAIAALTLLPEPFELRIAGDGPDRDRLSRLAHQLGVGERVTFLGYVASVGPLLDAADVIAHPSFAETFGYVLVEAASRHKPVAVLDMPVMNEFVPELVCGSTAARPCAEAYARAIMQALSTEWRYDEADSRRAERLDRDSIVTAWLEVMRPDDYSSATVHS